MSNSLGTLKRKCPTVPTYRRGTRDSKAKSGTVRGTSRGTHNVGALAAFKRWIKRGPRLGRRALADYVLGVARKRGFVEIETRKRSGGG